MIMVLYKYCILLLFIIHQLFCNAMFPVQTAQGLQRESPGVRIPLWPEGQVADEPVL